MTEALRPLDPVEQRVLGSLLEKERTVPASYPMTLNGLRTACNQTSGRDPITDLDDGEIERSLDRLKALGVARMVHASHGARTVKYRQVLSEVLDLGDGERAVVTLLLLRGPQTPGELRSRSERLHAFADLDEVQASLGALAERDLVEELPRRPGQKEQRWAHLLGPVDPSGPGDPGRQPLAGTSSAVPADPRERDAKVAATYTTVVEDYVDFALLELDDKPFDRWFLERLVDLADGGPIADAGCGPGHVAFHLASTGGDVHGFDLTPAMVDAARDLFPELPFEVGDLTDLPAPASSPEGWAVGLAWYSLVHLVGAELAPAIALLARSVRPGGWVAVALHVGADVRHLDEWLGHDVDIEFTLHDEDQVLEAFGSAGLVDVEWYRRGPYTAAALPETTQRTYVLGRRV